MNSLIKNLRSTWGDLRQDFLDLLQPRRDYAPGRLTREERYAVDALKRDGYVVIPNYFSRDYAFQLRDRLEATLVDGVSREYDCGAYLRVWDDRAYDEGVRRLYHVERLFPELKSHRFNPFPQRVASAYYRTAIHTNMLIFQHNTKSNANTRYHHVDSFCKEFKSFVYLDDVDEGNGPFTYIRGSHKNIYRRLKKQILGNKTGSPTSLYEKDIKMLLKDETKILGPAGTLILADVRGIHRGSPQTERSRSVLVNYMLRHEGDIFLDR